MATVELPNDQWLDILQFLRSCSEVYVGQEAECRCFLEGVLRMARSGAQWRLLPDEYGKWNTIYKRFARWCEKSIWERMHSYFADDPDMEHLIIDSTVVRASPLCRWSPPKRVLRGHKLWDAAGAGFSTKIDISVDALGIPLRFILTGGQVHDVTQAEALIARYSSEHVIADKGYDLDAFLEVVLDSEALPVIPPRSNRKEGREYDKYLYRERHLVECFINKIKHYRHIFSRFDKISRRYLGFLSFVGPLIRLR